MQLKNTENFTCRWLQLFFLINDYKCDVLTSTYGIIILFVYYDYYIELNIIDKLNEYLSIDKY